MGDFKIDISKITNSKLQDLAAGIDAGKNNNGYLDGEEITVFESVAKAAYSKEDIDQAMGLKIETKAPKTEIDWGKTDDKTLVRQIKNLEANGAKLSDMANHESKIVKDVYAQMPQYTSAEDVRKQHDEVVKNLKNAGIKDNVHMDVLKQLEKMAINEFQAEAYDEIDKLYQAKAKQAKEEGKKVNDEVLMDEVKKELKNNKKFKAEIKEAFKDYENNEIRKEARMDMLKAIYSDTEETKWRKLRKGAQESLDVKHNKYARKAFGQKFGDAISGESNESKDHAKIAATRNNVADKVTQSHAEVKKALGKNSKAMQVFKAMVDAGIVVQNEEGYWDLSKLSQIIHNQVGDDYTLSKHAKANTYISERNALRGELAEAGLDIDDITEKEAIALLELCGYRKDGTNWGKVFLKTLFGFAAGTAAGAGAAATNSHTVNFTEGDIKNHLSFELNGVNASDLKSSNLPEGTQIIPTSYGVKIVIDQLIEGESFALKLTKFIPETALKVGGITAALAFLNALIEDKHDGEVGVIATAFEEKTLEDYLAVTAQKNPKYAEVAKQIALSFVDKDGNWDREGYKDFLNTAAGNNSSLNKKELIAALMKRLEEVKNTPVEPAPVVSNKEEKDEEPQVCNVVVSNESTPESTTTEDLTKIHTRKGGDTWKGLVEAYYPDLVKECGGLYGKNGAIRALKEALSYNEDGSFNKETFNKLLQGGDIPKTIKLPATIGKTQRVDGTVKAGDVSGNGRALINEVGRNDIKITRIPGTSMWKAIDGCDDKTAPAYGTSKEEAIAKLEEQTGKKYENVIEQ